jgi:hypothetical protein
VTLDLALIWTLLVLWLVLSLPVAVLVGRCIRVAEVADAARRRAPQEPDTERRLADIA